MRQLDLLEKTPPLTWGDGHPLPYPCWTNSRKTVIFPSLSSYEEFIQTIEPNSAEQLQEHTYNTVGGFVRFYESWQKSRTSLKEFFHVYQPPIIPEHFTCVGLISSLRRSIVNSYSDKYPFLPSALYYVSCEEKIWCAERYMEQCPPNKVTAEKEHVMMAMKFKIGSESREGVMILDPGYHIPMPITCMVDRKYPHTGTWFHKDGTSTVKEYSYQLNQRKNYIKWNVTVTKPGKTPAKHESLIYVDLPYLSKESVSERRNLVFPFKSWVKRDMKGRIPAGVYFNIPESLQDKQIQVTAFYLNGKERLTKKQNVEEEWSREWINFLIKCGELMEVDIPHLFQTVHRLCKCLKDTQFLQQVSNINNDIYEMSVDN